MALYIQNQYVTMFDSNLKGSDKVTIKNLSTSERKQDGTYENESWTGRFVGKAKALVDTLPAKTRIKITGNVHPGYDKESKRNYPYVLVTGAEVLESNGGGNAPAAPSAANDDLPDVNW